MTSLYHHDGCENRDLEEAGKAFGSPLQDCARARVVSVGIVSHTNWIQKAIWKPLCQNIPRTLPCLFLFLFNKGRGGRYLFLGKHFSIKIKFFVWREIGAFWAYTHNPNKVVYFCFCLLSLSALCLIFHHGGGEARLCL